MTEEHTKQTEHYEEYNYNNFGSSWKFIITLISLITIALGNLDGAWEGVLKIWDFGHSTFTNQPSHNHLNQIYINASSNILGETFGPPVYIKHTTNGDDIYYYKDKHFILSAITKNNTIAAFLVFPDSDFKPNTSEHAGGKDYLSQPFSAHENLVSSHSNIARVGNYYIEEITGGKFDMLYSSVGGVSEYLGVIEPEKMKVLADFNDKLMMEEETKESLQKVRLAFTPNFYGYSSVGIAELEQAILTFLEYELITNKIG
ncbi:hypothetical protein CSW98_12270 [Vibrio sp. HA2012]|uniref:ETEC_3214 domain-containing protein n=1 Tax=Vibrio sp. HA2012 TaxID=1971595 RepID=UPI000C2BD3D7|nr:ETEC_3214 domain-containing protein [Vibrio sp. HA2012]PJC85828.1 hypothetical protein CSW98_12270 [Vibrio sp. HA2012]